MAALLKNCIREEQRSVIRFLWSEGLKPREIHRRMIQQYGGSCMSERKMYQWVERFQEGRTSVVDEYRSGRPCTLYWKTYADIVLGYEWTNS
jgi:transposase